MSSLKNINDIERPFEKLNAEDQRNYKIGDTVIYSAIAGLILLIGVVVFCL